MFRSDVNECAGELSENGTLSTDFENGCEVCNNICGGYKCSCDEGRVLDTDGKSCYGRLEKTTFQFFLTSSPALN